LKKIEDGSNQEFGAQTFMWGFDLFERVRFELLGKGQSLVEDMSVSQQAAVKGISNRL